jgi:glycosyltransferase involved in cell wall biosynthesis
MVELGMVADRAHEFDLVHFHLDCLGLPSARSCPVPSLHTLHGRLDLPSHRSLYGEFRDLAYVSISDAQREPLSDLDLGWLGTVYHGLPVEEYRVGGGQGGYLAFLGRISPEKRPDVAIRVARRAGLPLKIAAKVDRKDRKYFDEAVRPLLGGGGVEFIGEIGGEERSRFLGEAVALLFPIDWPEPFGLVGSVPEIIVHGRTGYIVDTEDDLVEAVRHVQRIERATCRREMERRFSDSRMALAYERVYARLLADRVRR